MNSTAAFLDWGAAVSFDTLLGLNIAAVQLPYFLVGMAIIVGVVTLWNKPRQCVRYLFDLVLAAVVARFVLVELIRLAIQTARPYVEVGFIPYIDPVNEFSFPSGHTAVLSALAFVAYGIRPAAGTALLAGAIIVGVARVLAGVHWPFDIIGGVFVGLTAALLVEFVPRLYRHLAPRNTHS